MKQTSSFSINFNWYKYCFASVVELRWYMTQTHAWLHCQKEVML